MPRKPAAEPRPYGKKGWTDKEPVYSLWRKYIPKFSWYSETKMDNDLIYFSAMPLAEAVKLFQLMPETCQEQNVQNGDLTMLELLNLASPGSLVHGYVVRKERADERISFEGLFVPEAEAAPVLCELINNNWIPDNCDLGIYRAIWDNGELIESRTWEAEPDGDLSDYWKEYTNYFKDRPRTPLAECPKMYRLWWD